MALCLLVSQRGSKRRRYRLSEIQCNAVSGLMKLWRARSLQLVQLTFSNIVDIITIVQFMMSVFIILCQQLTSCLHCVRAEPGMMVIVKLVFSAARCILLRSWWRSNGSIVVRPPVLLVCFPYPCARLTAGRVPTLWVKRPLSVNQQGRLSLPFLRGRLNE